MIVTDLEYALENRLIAKIDLMVERCCRDKVEKDALLINEGSEGEGKTNSSIAEAYYVQWKMKEKYHEHRDIHLFFRLKSMLYFAKTTEKKIIIWDEPSLDSLKKDAVSYMNTLLQRLLMTCRQKRHFFIVNLTKFFKFNEYIVVDRCLGMLHMYSRNEIEPGRFVYIKKRNLENLYQAYLSKKKRLYGLLSSFHGSFPEIMKEKFDKMDITVDNIPHATYTVYKQIKNKAIESIGDDESGMSKRELNNLKKLGKIRLGVTQLIKKFNINQQEAAELLKINSGRLREWAKIDLNDPISIEKDDFEASSSSNISY